MQIRPPICYDCKHLIKNDIIFICDAFPVEIPDIILTGENDHTKPLPEQGNNIVFEPIE